ncbi:MAG: GTPase [Anaerolineaceae bacterium]|nr:GTPase [Anaerolineaceae bacterium]
MATIDELIQKMPPETQEAFKIVWESLPVSQRKDLLSLITSFPSDINLVRMLVNLSSVQLRHTFGQKHRVAIVGPANVGKSTLYNQLVQSKEDRAQVSPIPGTTRANQQADAGLFAVIDTPGADAVGELGEAERDAAFQAAYGADFLIVVFDAIQGIKKTELELFHELTVLDKPYLVVLNKVDLVRKDQRRAVEQAAASLRLEPEQVIPLVAKNGENLDKVVLGIAATEPSLMASLGQALPQYRWQLAWRSIVSAASISAAIALAPLPVIDFAPLLVNQSVMVLGIARIYNYKINLERARELVVTFGLGFLGRTLFAELSKLGGVPGWVLSAAIAASTTVVMGYAASVWFERGQKVNRASLKQMTQEMTQYLLETLRELGKKKPTQESLQERIAAALQRSPLSRDRAPLDEQAQAEEPKEPEEP